MLQYVAGTDIMQSQTISLQQRQQLQMILAPQLRQSLEMLQVPILELRAMLQQEIEQNPTLEEKIESTDQVEIEPEVKDEKDEHELEFDKEFEALAQLDEEWRDYFFQNLEVNPYSAEHAEKRQFLLDSLPQRESLQEHLLNQLNLAGFSETDRQVAELITGSINEDGYLMTDLKELAASAGCDAQHLEDILLVIQDFHPTGVGARNLRECLLIQLERLSKTDSLAADIVREQLGNLGARKINDIAKALQVTAEQVQEAAKFISTLDPKPGRIYSDETSTYILPEVFVHKTDGKYEVVLNDDQLPHIRISNHYRKLLSDKSTSKEVRAYIREKIQSGAFMIKSIHQRQRTIHRIASEIVATQKSFLDYGIAHLKPLTMSEVAKAVGVHETTVSRAVSGKYMRAPSGVFDMKYFFTPGIKTASGKEVSNKTVKDIMANLVANEDPLKPFSDQDIMRKLSEQGIDIARRTVAKYRLVLHIPPSHMRKMY
ncbi:RNA polymerase factor sigma-54 [Verrucomicrobiota bacterium]